MPELDTVRGLAILGVLLYHGLYWGVNLSHFSVFQRSLLTLMWIGRLGVDLFFVLSGFLITRLLLEAKGRTDYYRRFYVRRALRILPAYFTVILVLLLTHYAPINFILLSVLYLSNLTPLFGIPIAYPVLWSLAVEEHYYFLWPCAIRKWSSTALIVLAASVIILSPLSRLLSFYLTQSNGLASFVCNEYTWNSLDGLACGAVLAILLMEYSPSRELVWKALIATSLIALGIWAIGLPFGILSRQNPVGAALQVTPWHLIFTTMIGFCLLAGSSTQKHYVQLRPLRFLGEISYGLYLYHLFAFNAYDKFLLKANSFSSSFGMLWARCLIASCVAIFTAYISRRSIEDYFLRAKAKLAP